MNEHTQESIDKLLHIAIKESDIEQVRYLLSSPELPVHADINSLNKYKQPVWGYLSKVDTEVQDYILHFDYIADKEVKNATIKNFLIGLSAAHYVYPVEKIIEHHKSILDSDTLNTALLYGVRHYSIETLPALLSHHFPEHVWKKEEALLLALIYDTKTTKMPDIIMNYDTPGTVDNTTLKSLQDSHRGKWLENLLVQLNIDFKMNEHTQALIDNIGETGNINLLNYFTTHNKYGVILQVDNGLFKTAIRNRQYDLIEELMMNYGVRVDEEIQNYAQQYENFKKDNILEKITHLQAAIDLKIQLENDLPVNNKVRRKSKI